MEERFFVLIAKGHLGKPCNLVFGSVEAGSAISHQDDSDVAVAAINSAFAQEGKNHIPASEIPIEQRVSAGDLKWLDRLPFPKPNFAAKPDEIGFGMKIWAIETVG